jgi:hypothetical protein
MDRPTFGVLPHQGSDEVREFDHLGHRVLGIEYSSGTDVVGDTCCVVQLRTPVVPTLVIAARPQALAPERFTPLEDAKLTKNLYNTPKPDVALEKVEPGVDLYKRFTVISTDPEFATAVLSGARELLTTDPWFRVRAVTFHDGSLWTGQSGRLTDEVLHTNACHLARLAAAVPADAWQDDAFLSVVRTADTSDEAWGRRGVTARLNRRRRAADRQPVTGRSLVIRTVFALALLLLGLPLIGNGFAALTGLAPEVRMKVTEAFDSSGHEDARDLVSGTYEADGVTHTVTDSHWSTFGDLPLEGSAINVHIGPFWWGPMIEAPDTAVFMILLGLVPVLPGVMLARRTYLPRPPRRAGDESGRG